MSTVLKALKKSEQERRRGTVPTLGRASKFAPPPGRPVWPWWVGGGAALNVAALAAIAWWLSASLAPEKMAGGAAVAPSVAPSEARASVAVAPAMAAVPSPEAAVAETADPSPEAAVAEAAVRSAPATPEPPAPVELAEARPAAAGTDERRAEPAPEAATVLAARAAPEATSEIQVSLAAGTMTSPPPASPLDARTEIEYPAPTAGSALARALPEPSPAVAAMPELPPPVEVPRAVVVPPRTPVSGSEARPDPYATLPALFHLPTSIRGAIPELPITVHVFDENAGSRFVIIRSRKYREGDRLSDNLILESIAPGGLVLRYRETAFRVDL